MDHSDNGGTTSGLPATRISLRSKTQNLPREIGRSRAALLADFVAKVGGTYQRRNNRIQKARHLNQSCVIRCFLESIFRHNPFKIVLQQYLPQADLRCGEPA
jgi:hypothetical protein